MVKLLKELRSPLERLVNASKCIKAAKKKLSGGIFFGPNPAKSKKYTNEALKQINTSTAELVEAYRSLLKVGEKEALCITKKKREDMGNSELEIAKFILQRLIKNFDRFDSRQIIAEFDEADKLLESQINLIGNQGFSMYYTKREQ